MAPDIAVPRIAARAPVAVVEAPVAAAAAAAIAEHGPGDVQAAGRALGNPDFPSYEVQSVQR